jgi:ATP-dependent helicase/nuclease subunit A
MNSQLEKASAQLDNASARQRRASDPKLSAWVSANAGSGKTHVLALRVIRLLLDGAAPSKILCLTFTKAAAANMAERVFDRLSRWTQFDDSQLKADIVEAGAPAPTPGDLERARKLFARVLETPGGLKIQTIHAFCERVLHMFPFEANVPAAFRALDERDAAVLRELSQARVFAGAERDATLSEAIARVAAAVGAEGFAPLIVETARLGDELAAHGPPDVFAQKLAARLGLAPGEDEAAVAREMAAGGGGPAVWRRWAQALNQGSKTDQKLAALLLGASVAPNELTLEIYQQVFLVDDGAKPRARMATKAVIDKNPDVAEALTDERDRLFSLLDKKRVAAVVARSLDLHLVSRACESAYKRAKAARSALDFDDLIAKTQNLFARADAAWVLFKLDKGVEHILVDEAQDTSRAQWSILAKLAEDFLSGAGLSAQGRTFFAVGDEKQSIFSFQGAEPHLFDEQRRFFARAHAQANLPFVEQPLIHSFRSAPAVLDAVDKVFGVAQVWRGVSAAELSAPPHAAIREALPGLVEIWPTLALEPPPEPGEWRLPLDAQKATHPAQVLADRIAEQIARWTAPGSPERIVDKQTHVARPIRPGDVLILVRARAALFEALTRALRRRRVPAAGADRLTLAAHIAVLDLCAAARVALNPDDDLALAAVLKSPLIGLTDDALIRLSPLRSGSLSAALAADPAYAAASAKIAIWRARAGLGPFDFFARLLGAEGGRRALVGRLGGEAGDVIDEFLARGLAHERDEAPSLTRFLDEIEAADSKIKRDMEAGVDQVRVMTVHAAKGLEAPIVFLPDTGGAPTGRHDPKWLRLPPQDGGAPLLVWAGSAADDSEEMARARAVVREGAAGEHRRLLYVAMTRAAQRLIIAGFRGKNEPPADNWAELIASGLAQHAHEAPSWWNPAETILRLGQGVVGAGGSAFPPPSPPAPPPAWATAPAPREIAYAPAAPARRVAGDVGPARLARLEEGRLAHKLMQSLPALAPERRRAAAAAYLARAGAALPESRRETLADRLLKLVEAPALAPLFGAGSRAEVPFAASLARVGGLEALVEGRIDRLAVASGEVWVADFKTGSPSVRKEYRRQLAVYRAAAAAMFPGLKTRAYLLWIDSGIFEELAGSTLNDAYLDWAGEGAQESSPS